MTNIFSILIALLIFQTCAAQQDALPKYPPCKYVGLCQYYDAEGAVYKKVWYSETGITDSVKYVNPDGVEVKDFIPVQKIPTECLLQIKSAIEKGFNWKNVTTEGQGLVMLTFFVSPTGGIEGLHLLRGINSTMNAQVKRAAQALSKEDVECAVHSLPSQILVGLKFGPDDSDVQFVYSQRVDSCNYISSVKKWPHSKIRFEYSKNLGRQQLCIVDYVMHNKKYFFIGNEKIYLVTDKAPQFKGDLCDLFKSNYIPPQKDFGHNPMVVIAFVIDAKGNITDKGFLLPEFEEYFNDQAAIVLNKISNVGSFSPALVKGQPVSSVYSMRVPYIGFHCKETKVFH